MRARFAALYTTCRPGAAWFRVDMEASPCERSDLDAVTFLPIGGKTPITSVDSLIANCTG